MAYTKQNFEDGQVLTAEHLNKMETELAREKSWNELADKPFGDVPTVILEEQELVFDPDEGGCLAEVSVDVKDGDVLTIAYDGSTYSCEVYSSGGMSGLFGNGDLMGLTGGNAEPFFGMCMDGVFFVVPEDQESASHIIGCSKLTIEKLNRAYLDIPSVVILYADSENYLYSDSDTTDTSKRLTKAELESAFTAGLSIYLSADSAMYYPCRMIQMVSGLAYGVIVFLDTNDNRVVCHTSEYTAS